MVLRTKQIGSCTLYEGPEGRWSSLELGRRSSRAFTLLQLHECEVEDYLAELNAEFEDRCEGLRQLGRPARGPFGRWLLRRHLAPE